MRKGTKHLSTASCCLLALSVALLSAEPATKSVAVFVTSAGALNGMTDPNKENQDTMKDLRDSLKGKKGVVLTDNRADARIVLVVMNREKAQITAGLLGDPARDCTVRVKFIFNGAETELSGSAQGGTLSSGGAWGRAAGKVARQVEEWVKANSANVSAK